MSASDALKSLLGEELLSKTGMVKTADALGGKKLIMVYFSAHWCPPCRGFTPKLIEKYNASAVSNQVEVVFVSSDRDEEAFAAYFGEMPWLAVPHADRDRKSSLSEKYGVRGIPSLIVLNADGELVTTEGRAQLDKFFGDNVVADATPAKGDVNSSHFIDLLGEELSRKAGKIKTAEALAGRQLIMLYFSAHWCPPCRGFTPHLAAQYKKAAAAKGIEVVFVSSDMDENSFKSYHGEMPWLAVPYADRTRASTLGDKYGVEGIPALIVLNANGDVVTKEGRAEVDTFFGAAGSGCCTIS